MKIFRPSVLATLLVLAASCAGPKETKAELTWIPDVPGPKMNPTSLFGEVPQSLVDSLGLQDGVPGSMSAFLVEKDGHRILFDAGLGTPGSLLIPTLAQKGIAPEDIEMVCITHLHFDHIGGLVKDGRRAFPNAVINLNVDEFNAWMAMDSTQNEAVRHILDLYAYSVKLFDADTELDYGIVPICAAGHTPGHTAYRIGDILIAGDVMHGVALQMADPTFCARFDMDYEKSVETRNYLIDYARNEKLLLCGMHFPEPGTIDFREQ